MEFRHKVMMLAALPLLLAALAMGFTIHYESARLSQRQMAGLEPLYDGSKRTELKHYVDLAASAIRPLYESGRNDEAAKTEVRAILNRLDYGDDGYFFVYDMAGNNLMHPRQPELVGRNLWNLRDANGNLTIQRLIAAARAGGGFVAYRWERPSTRHVAEKLGYVIPLPRWGWMIGTGIYLDDKELALAQMRHEVQASIDRTELVISSIAIAAVLAVFACGLWLNISERRLADARLRKLAQRVVTSQEDERARVARELHDGISQLLVSAKYALELAHERVLQHLPDALTPFENGLARLRQALREVRLISHDLRPALLDNLGLGSALELLGREFGERTGASATVSIQALPEQIDADVSTALFRITQEALTNIERHAKAASVSIHLGLRHKHLLLAIRDDGTGFNVRETERTAHSGIGLKNMRERVEHLGGRLSIKSSSSGTEIRALVKAGEAS